MPYSHLFQRAFKALHFLCAAGLKKGGGTVTETEILIRTKNGQLPGCLQLVKDKKQMQVDFLTVKTLFKNNQRMFLLSDLCTDNQEVTKEMLTNAAIIGYPSLISAVAFFEDLTQYSLYG